MMRAKILIVDVEESLRYTFSTFLSDEGHEVSTAKNYDDALEKITKTDFDLIFMDIILGGQSGIELLQENKRLCQKCPVIMITGYPSIETASDALRLGAFDYILKPIQQETLIHTANMALKFKSIQDENEKYRSNLEVLFDSIKDSIITVDENLTVTAINKAAVETCGISKDLLGKSLEDFKNTCLCKHDTDCSCKCIEAMIKTVRTKKDVEVYRTECSISSPAKQVVTIKTSPLLNRHDKFTGALMVISDETRINELERNLRERLGFHNIIGQNQKMQKIYSLMEDLANVETNVLITGESGTGKELIAEALHYTGNRSNYPLVKVNCSALSENLLESELFGHVKGAFTGADRNKVGRFELAGKGTIFLDEIGDISPRMQLRLLRAIQEKEFERVGESTSLKINARIIAATNQDLQQKVTAGEFREDLMFRLKVFEISLPPLRDRPDDIPLLTKHFIEKMNTKFNKKIIAASENVQKIFLNYTWPGNIRELEHSMEHAFVIAKQDILTVDLLPSSLVKFSINNGPSINKQENLEPDIILNALKRSGWNKSKAARLLNITVRTIYRKIEKYDLKERENI